MLTRNKVIVANQKVLCIGDSLATPSTSDIMYEDTWIYKMKIKYPEFDFISQCKGGSDTRLLVSQGGGGVDPKFYPKGSDYLEHFKPSIVILQMGIVDCAPRLFNKRLELRLLKARIMPSIVATLYIKLKKKYYGRQAKHAFVPAREFENNLNNYFLRCSRNNVSKLVIVLIGTPGLKMVENNPRILVSINIYNQIYKKFAAIYPFIVCVNPLIPTKYDSGIYLEDGYHPNRFGNTMVFEEVCSALESVNDLY